MPPTRKRSFKKDSPFIKIHKETNQDSSLRVRLIKQLKERLESNVVTFFTSFDPQRNGNIQDSEAEMLEGLLSFEHEKGKKLTLIVNSPGGSGMAAERIVNTSRAYSENKFEVIVPHMAKSAATMICFGANVIHMSRTAELGPVDPQLAYTPGLISPAGQSEQIGISAEEYIRSYEKLMEQASNGKAPRIEPFIQQLNRYDSRFIEQLRSAQQLGKDISLRLLESGMMNGTPSAEIEKKITVFLSQTQKSSHGRMISASEAKGCGLNVKKIDLQSELWHDLWELYERSNWFVSHRASKLIETSENSVSSQ